MDFKIPNKIKKMSLLKVLKLTAGAWADHDWKEYDRLEAKRRRRELAASRERKNAY